MYQVYRFYKEVFWEYARFKHPSQQISFHSIRAVSYTHLDVYKRQIQETARLTEEQAELNEDKKEELNEKLQELMAHAEMCIRDSPYRS